MVGDEIITVVNRDDFRLELRPAGLNDTMLLWEWVNDPEVRASAFHSEVIEPAEHRSWFGGKLADPDCLILIAEDGRGLAVGQVRFEQDGADAEIDVSIAAAHRGRGFGVEIIKAGVGRFYAERPLIRQINARVKPDNRASLASFGRAGFTEIGLVEFKGRSAVQLVRRRNDG